MKLFCGIDWAEAHHDVAIVDENGQLVAKNRMADDPTGLTQLVELFAEVGDGAAVPIPVAIETPRGLLMASLRATGRAIYSINPLAVALYRELHSVARAKSDHADARPAARAVLAIAPTPGVAAKLPVSRVAAALRRAGRSRGIDRAAADITTALRKPQMRHLAQVETAMGKQTLALLAPVIHGVVDGSRSG